MARGCRDMPLYAAICRSLERTVLIFFGLGFFSEPEGRGLRATLRVAKPSQPKAARESLPARCGSRAHSFVNAPLVARCCASALRVAPRALFLYGKSRRGICSSLDKYDSGLAQILLSSDENVDESSYGVGSVVMRSRTVVDSISSRRSSMAL